MLFFCPTKSDALLQPNAYSWTKSCVLIGFLVQVYVFSLASPYIYSLLSLFGQQVNNNLYRYCVGDLLTVVSDLEFLRLCVDYAGHVRFEYKTNLPEERVSF